MAVSGWGCLSHVPEYTELVSCHESAARIQLSLNQRCAARSSDARTGGRLPSHVHLKMKVIRRLHIQGSMQLLRCICISSICAMVARSLSMYLSIYLSI